MDGFDLWELSYVSKFSSITSIKSQKEDMLTDIEKQPLALKDTMVYVSMVKSPATTLPVPFNNTLSRPPTT